jgi:hypothetical protein
MAKRKTAAEVKIIKPSQVVRQGWLAYLGVYGVAFDRAKPALEKLRAKYAEFFGELVEKGAEIEATAKEQIADAGERAKGFYGAGVEKFRDFSPVRGVANDRVKELEAEVEALTKKLEGARRPTRAKRAKAA